MNMALIAWSLEHKYLQYYRGENYKVKGATPGYLYNELTRFRGMHHN
jgi:hypothetical protein